jgi:adenylate cyclase
MSTDPVVPLLSKLAPDGFAYTGQYMVEFDADSLWYETSLTIAGRALQQGLKTEYHVFDHFPSDARQALSKMGLDPARLEADGLLDIWDSYTETTEFERTKTAGTGWESSGSKPLDIVKGAARWVERTKAGFQPAEKRWLHLDDNTGIFLQYNDEETVVDRWRTALLPAVRARECPHFLAFPRNIASAAFYTKFESLCDGIIDLKTEEINGRIEPLLRIRRLKGKTFDSRWHRLEVEADGSVQMRSLPPSGSPRRLAAIMFTDMVGFTAMAQRNEALSLELLEEHRAMLRPIFQRHGGTEVKTIGDGFLVEFTNALEAVRCAYEIQRTSREANHSRPSERQALLRVGVHLGDVVETDGDISGDAVNVAARIEPLAEAGGVCISRQVYDQVQNKFELSLTSLGAQPLKNVSTPLEVFKVVMPWAEGGGAGTSEVDPNRIAILPLANFSPAAGDEYFADGMMDEIISTVSGISGLSVISRTSAMRYKQTSKSMTEIGRELKAGKLLEGSVRKSGNRVRITVQLIDSASDAHLWSKSYDGSMDDIFETQSDIARKIAEALKLPSPRPGGRAENPDAHAICLRARTLWNKSTRESNEQATLLFEEALKIDPESARATAGLAMCYASAADWGSIDTKEGYDKARALARRALELDETLPEAHIALGSIMMLDDFPGAEAELQKALSLNPSHADAHEWYASILRGLSRLEESFEEAKKAYELDPLPPSRAFFVCTEYFFMGRNDEALAVCNRIIQTEPGFAWGYAGRAVLTALKGSREEAYRDLQTYRRLSGEIPYKSLQARVEAHLGNREEASRLIDETLALVAKSDSPDARAQSAQLSYASALIGDRERFFQIAEEMIQLKTLGPGELQDPSYQNMASDPRFADLRKKLRKSYGISN